MQLNPNQWTIMMIAIGVFGTSTFASSSPQAQQSQASSCFEPGSAVLPEVHVHGQNRLKALARFASENGLCLGIEDVDGLEISVSLDTHQSPVSQVLMQFLPGFSIVKDGPVFFLRRSARTASWLDFKLNRFEVNRATLNFNSLQLFSFLQGQTGLNTNYIGSVSETFTDNFVGPLAERGRSIRELLDLLLARSTKGGLWFTKRPHLKSESLGDSSFWTVIPFGSSVQESIARIDLSQ